MDEWESFIEATTHKPYWNTHNDFLKEAMEKYNTRKKQGKGKLAELEIIKTINEDYLQWKKTEKP